ncbi:hypothetical protein Cgig2_027370 [Carnegiea gigantea]|uniref:Uncharacterized protein n=1 Tax=Carnegiea gigantea TaxID=171969 RepID=A0A9Q1QG85_9CARY|nr:hypothetical protein Cgig2_027370 [Carnegiea gigantea]
MTIKQFMGLEYSPIAGRYIAIALGKAGGSSNLGRPSCLLGVRSSFVFQNTRPRISCSISMSDGHSGDNGRLNLDHIKDKARRVWEDLPHPIKSFPWSRVQDNFIQFLFGIASTVIKYLSAPLLAVSALSEMSYCAHERKLFLVPVPLAVGFLVAGILKEAASELSPLIQASSGNNDAEVPWHLIAIAGFFVLLKLPGPYYPYWGRMLMPHFANGALLSVFWMVYLWYRRPKEPVNAELEQGVDSLCRKYRVSNALMENTSVKNAGDLRIIGFSQKPSRGLHFIAMKDQMALNSLMSLRQYRRLCISD